jgi:glycosyltransferase involved in cell wall biosynthesis
MKKLVSIILITYNQEEWVEHAVLSALNQNYENLEIIISDDCSTDKTWSVINKITRRDQYENKKIILNKNAKNLGITANITHALKSASGDLFVIFAGDDVSTFNRVSTMVDQWEKFGYPAAIASSLNIIDKDGFSINNHERELLFNHTQRSTKLRIEISTHPAKVFTIEEG